MSKEEIALALAVALLRSRAVITAGSMPAQPPGSQVSLHMQGFDAKDAADLYGAVLSHLSTP